MKLLTTNNTKILKSAKRGYLTFGLHLLPGRTCPRASSGCLKSCLNLSGHGRFRQAQEARARKTKLFWEDPIKFVGLLCEDIERACKQADRKGLIPAFRLNLTSDIPWEHFGVPQKFPDTVWYDYTKYHDRHPPPNYHLTFSRSESLQNHIHAKQWLKRGGNVAVVFGNKELPNEFWGTKVVSGDEDDLRFLDPKPAIIGLSPKGRAKVDTTGFVVL